MTIQYDPIGTAYIKYKGKLPKHWSVSDIEGTLVINAEYHEGLKDLREGQWIIVLFHFHRSPDFTPEFLTQALPHRPERIGVFSLRSPTRPNAIGMSVLQVLGIEDHIVHVKGLDMFDGTPILDIKPYRKP
jgi:tRNA-Thr(GGU) m(6)t(6)A37 methyltransferase TsaA